MDLSEEERQRLKFRVMDLYRRAYDLEPLDPPESSVVTTVRAEIRRWITYWDLQRYYPSEEGVQVVTEEPKFDEGEIDEGVMLWDSEGGEGIAPGGG